MSAAAALGYAVLSAAQVVPRWPLWTAYTTLGIQTVFGLLNWITPSKPERRLWGPITTVMLVLAVIAVFF